MKRTLLTSTALVAFAGAAAADISFSGEASFSYHDTAGYSDSVSITASGSQALDNGYTASASLTFAPGAGTDGDIDGGDISIANDSSSITYHIGTDGAGAAYIGDVVGGSAGLAGIFEDADTVGEDATISASMTLAGATVDASLHAGNAYEIGVATDLGGSAVAIGFDGSDFGAQLSGSASAVDYTMAFGSNDTFGVSASTTAGGADLTLSMAEGSVWSIGASMPMGAATAGVTLNSDETWDVTVDTTLEAVSLGFSFDEASDWDMTASYAADGVGVSFATDEASAWSMDVTYDLGNGLTAGAGTNSTSNAYAEVNYDLGGGAALAIEYGDGNDGPDDDIVDGTTLEVSFSF